ncbi:MAG: lytic transglycosylase domain-containing protein [Pyrinomonadaceae bacterium]
MGTPTEVNAVFARLRLDVANRDFAHALALSEELQTLASTRGASTNATEVTYLRAYSLEKLGRKQEAASVYLTIADEASSYYGNLATKHLLSITPNASVSSTTIRARQTKASQEVKAYANQYPALFREIILRHAKQRNVDPRLILAIMKQESSFNARAKSPAAARGLMQLTFDTAMKYVSKAGLKNLQEDDLYKPEVSIQLACIYLSELALMFPNLPEAVAASVQRRRRQCGALGQESSTKRPRRLRLRGRIC